MKSYSKITKNTFLCPLEMFHKYLTCTICVPHWFYQQVTLSTSCATAPPQLACFVSRRALCFFISTLCSLTGRGVRESADTASWKGHEEKLPLVIYQVCTSFLLTCISHYQKRPRQQLEAKASDLRDLLEIVLMKQSENPLLKMKSGTNIKQKRI